MAQRVALMLESKQSVELERCETFSHRRKTPARRRSARGDGLLMRVVDRAGAIQPGKLGVDLFAAMTLLWSYSAKLRRVTCSSVRCSTYSPYC